MTTGAERELKVDRILGKYGGGLSGNLLIVLAGVHGNEQAGLTAVDRVLKKLKKLQAPFEGELMCIAGNLKAIANAKRFIDIDLNRQWTKEKIEKFGEKDALITLSEEKEQAQLIRLFRNIQNTRSHMPTAVLDMHTTSAEGGTFVLANQTERGEDLASHLGLPVIMGVEDTIQGTTMSYLSSINLPAYGIEAGQHYAENSIDRMESAIWLSLEKLNCIDAADKRFEIEAHKAQLNQLGKGLPSKVRFMYRHHIDVSDRFKMLPGFQNFDQIIKGQVLANDKNGEITAPIEGMILMPLYQEQGEDGFFIVHLES